jgi:hypothetical protein
MLLPGEAGQQLIPLTLAAARKILGPLGRAIEQLASLERVFALSLCLLTNRFIDQTNFILYI